MERDIHIYIYIYIWQCPINCPSVCDYFQLSNGGRRIQVYQGASALQAPKWALKTTTKWIGDGMGTAREVLLVVCVFIITYLRANRSEAPYDT